MRLRCVALAFLFALTGAGCGGEAKPEAPKPAAQPAKQAPLVPKAEIHDWCKEHGVPESICTKCTETLIAGFKAKGDWCKEHGLPESQCLVCHPELKAKFEAMAPKDRR